MNTHTSKSRLIALCLSLAAVFGTGTASAQYRDDSYRIPPSNPQRDDDRYGDHDRNRYGYNDHAVQRHVQMALNRTLGRAANGINVRVDYGNVYLSGFVRHPGDRDAARNVATNVRGVRQVYARRLRVAYY